MITRQNINIKIKVFYNYIQNFIFSRGFKNEFMLYFRLFFNSDLRFYFNKFFKNYQQINIILSRQNKKIFDFFLAYITVFWCVYPFSTRFAFVFSPSPIRFVPNNFTHEQCFCY